MTIVQEFEKGKEKRKQIEKLEDELYKARLKGEDDEREIICLFYNLFENFSSKTIRTNIKIDRLWLSIGQVGFVLRMEPTEIWRNEDKRKITFRLRRKSVRVENISQLRKIFEHADKILPLIKRKTKRELFMVWENTLEVIPLMNAERNVNIEMIDDNDKMKHIDSIKIDEDDESELVCLRNGKEINTIGNIDLSNLDDIQEWAKVELIADDIIKVLDENIASYKVFGQKAKQIHKNLKDKCSKWLIVLEMGKEKGLR